MRKHVGKVDLTKCEVGKLYAIQLLPKEEPVRVCKCIEAGTYYRFDGFPEDMCWMCNGDCLSDMVIDRHHYDIVRLFEPSMYKNWNTSMEDLADLIIAANGTEEHFIACAVSKHQPRAVMIQKRTSNDEETSVNVIIGNNYIPDICGTKTATNKDLLVKWLSKHLVCWNTWPRTLVEEYRNLSKELSDDEQQETI